MAQVILALLIQVVEHLVLKLFFGLVFVVDKRPDHLLKKSFFRHQLPKYRQFSLFKRLVLGLHPLEVAEVVVLRSLVISVFQEQFPCI